MISCADFNHLIATELPMAQALGIVAEQISPAGASLRLPYGVDLLRPGGTIAGPAMMTLADVAMYAVVLGATGHVTQALTTGLNINFLRRPRPGDLVATGRALKRGRRLVVIAVDIAALDDRAEIEPLVAHAVGTYALPGD